MAEAKKGKTGGAKKKAGPAAKAKKKGAAKGGQSAKGVAGKAAKRPVKVAESKVAATKRNVRDQDFDDSDELPPDDVVEGEAAALDAETLASEVERAEAKDHEESGDDVPVLLPTGAVDEDADADADAVLPSMEGLSILRETELNDVIQDVKRRSEANGGYITYEELNQILPSNIVDAIQSDKYLKILEALGVQVIREDDVRKYLDAKSAKQSDPKARAAEMIEDPIRMYLHQMGQVQLLKREEEVEICTMIEKAEAKTRDVFNRFLFAPAMYASLLDRLEGQAALILNLRRGGLLFSYDLLGYGMMALSTFFVGLSMRAQNRADKWLKYLLMIHGAFFAGCFVMPMTGVFSGMADGETSNGGVTALLIWCACFLPAGALSLLHFRRAEA